LKPKLNRAWHAANRMPRNANCASRLEWHLNHESGLRLPLDPGKSQG
jgi:hypothetical protein